MYILFYNIVELIKKKNKKYYLGDWRLTIKVLYVCVGTNSGTRVY